jgi:hypothetical protein
MIERDRPEDIKRRALALIRQIQSIRRDSSAKIDCQAMKSRLAAPEIQNADRKLGALAGALSNLRKADSPYWRAYGGAPAGRGAAK